ncbi:MAG: LysR substrate-binding domain-containing protein [Oleiphilaceae bacterium]|nr:LysR substrate-binding domain-containing protein [Oleiphilaceae bacterium]
MQLSNQAPITLEALQVIDAIERRGSYAAAAEALDKVPSALSYIVQKLEEQLDVTLFQKQGRRSVLTPAGKHLLEEGRKLLHAANQLCDSTRSIAKGWESRIRIAIDSMFNTRRTFEIFDQFLQDHPDIELDIREEVMSGSWEALIEDQVDLLIGAAAPVPQQKGIHAVTVGKFDRVFAVSREHPLAQHRAPLSHEDLAKERTVVVHDSARMAIPWTKGIITRTRYFFVPTVDCKIRAQLAGIGCGYLPRQRVQPYLDSGELVELEVENSPQQINSDMYIAWKLVNRGKGLHALKERFISSPNDLMQSC